MRLDEQLSLEREMLELGTNKYLNSVNAKNDFDSIHTQIIIKRIIEPFSECIKSRNIKEHSEYKNGHKPSIMLLMEKDCIINSDKKDTKITSDQISFVLCRLLFNSIRHKPHKMVSFAQMIGTTLNTNLEQSDKLSDSAAFRVGVSLIDLFCSSFPDLVRYEYNFYDKKSKNKEYIIFPSQEFLDFVQDKIEAIAEITTVIYPMVYVPCDWDYTGKNGGFYSDELKTNIIKRKSVNEDSGINKIISNGVNLIQSTPWVVNNEIRLILKELNKFKPNTLKKLYPKDVPKDVDRPFGDDLKYADMDAIQKKSHQLWSRQCARNEKAREAKKSIEISRYSSMRQADNFYDTPEIFFPHDLDYRGRIYNKCMTGLNTQGSDHQKGLIKFGTPRPVLSDSGIRWMCINLANLAGHDKLKLDDRYAWCINNEDMFRDIAKDPIKCNLWHSWDKPVQGLSACLEYVKFLNNPEAKLNTHVQLDG